jgi:hypothetical protein
MDEVQVTIPAELLEAAGVNPADASRDATLLLTLELYRENKISLGRAAELCQTSVEAFMVFAGCHEVPDSNILRNWKKTAALLNAWARDCHFGFLSPHHSRPRPTTCSAP